MLSHTSQSQDWRSGQSCPPKEIGHTTERIIRPVWTAFTSVKITTNNCLHPRTKAKGECASWLFCYFFIALLGVFSFHFGEAVAEWSTCRSSVPETPVKSNPLLKANNCLHFLLVYSFPLFCCFSSSSMHYLFLLVISLQASLGTCFSKPTLHVHS